MNVAQESVRTDTELVAAYLKTNDEAAFGELMARHQAMVYRACLRMIGDHHEAEDAAQAVFITLARKASSLWERELSSWLYGVARRISLEVLRRRARQQKRATEAAEQFAAEGQEAVVPAAGRDRRYIP